MRGLVLCLLCLPLTVLGGAQKYEPLADSVRTRLSKLVSEKAVPAMHFLSNSDAQRWLTEMDGRLARHIPDRKLRFETAEEMLLALEQGEHKPVLALPRTPLLERDGVWLWRSIAIASVVLNLLLVYLLVIRKG